MTKIQIVEHDVRVHGANPTGYCEPLVSWLEQHGLKFVYRFQVDGDRLKGGRYLTNEDGNRYIWHINDHSAHTGNGCEQCRAGAQYEAAWETFDVPLVSPPPTFELRGLPLPVKSEEEAP